MAEVTYYWDSKISSVWTDHTQMIDGLLANFAYTASDGDVENLSTTTCDGTSLGTITKVEIRCYGYGDGDDRIDLYFNYAFQYQLTMPATENWSAYADVTADARIDGWTWAKIADLFGEMAFPLAVEFDKSGKGNVMYCAKVGIRVTYDEGGEPPLPNQFNKIFYTSEPPTPSAWNQVKQDAGSGYRKLEYS